MHYSSTRDNSLHLTAPQVIAQGLATDGGLYTPASLPQLPDAFWTTMGDLPYAQRAASVMRPFLPEFSDEELDALCAKAYAHFDHPDTAPVARVGDDAVLELWHGPTCAFKDMALQALPHLLTASLKKCGEQREVCILVATSGDTGKAALEGFKDVDGTKILVFYPRDGVSAVQQRQMVTQEGQNVCVSAVEGNFDDAQNGVKALFSDPTLRAQLNERNLFLSSANSINWGRVLPQLVYYVSAYTDMVRAGQVQPGQPINVCVPTGNFGNILAAYYAKQMGVPIARLLCASNQNDVLTRFITTGTYDRNRALHCTLSPSMDILISSNLERALHALSGGNDDVVRDLMRQLSQTGSYTVDAQLKQALQQQFYAACCDDATTKQTIAQVWRDKRYLLDPHTAVAYTVAQQYCAETGDNTPLLIVSTASPFKFADAVLSALQQPTGDNDEQQLAHLTGWRIPQPIAALAGKPIRFTGCTAKTELVNALSAFLSM